MINVHGGNIYQYKKENLIDFSANINPLGLPRGVKIAIADNLDQAVHYPDIHCQLLREKLARKYHLDKKHLLFGNGAADIIFAATIALKPRKSLLLSPTFAEYEQALRAIGSQIVYWDLKETEDFCLTKDFLNAITPDIDMVFLCNPNNPTGEVIPRKFLLQIIQKCKDNNCIIVVDECFNSFLEAGEDYSVRHATTKFDNLLVVDAFTKIYAMPGIRLGFGVINNKKVHQLIESSTQPWNVSVLAQIAGIAALDEKEYLIRTKELIIFEREYLITELTKLEFKVYGSKANYIFFKGPSGLCETCLQHNLLLRNCNNYRGLGEGFYRIAVRTHEENEKLITALHGLEE
jgi:threonine-phosphate decarboxylase